MNETSILPPGKTYCIVCGAEMRADGSCSNPACFLYWPPSEPTAQSTEKPDTQL